MDTPFVALEGIDASGKNTQARLLARRLEAELFSFPDYNTDSGVIIEGHLKQKWKAVIWDGDLEQDWADSPGLNAFVFQALQLMNRMEHATRLAEVLYKEQRPVVADRYTASGMVYGGMDGLDSAYLYNIHRFLPQPTLWVLIDIDPEQSVQRRPERRDRYESNIEYMGRVAEGYRALWSQRAAIDGEQKWVRLDGRRPVGDIHKDILEALERCGRMF